MKNTWKSFWLKNLASNKTQYYLDKFRKRRCEIQDCEGF